MSHSVAKTERSRHSVKRDAAVTHHMRLIMCFLKIKVCKLILEGPPSKSMDQKKLYSITSLKCILSVYLHLYFLTILLHIYFVIYATDYL